MSCSDDSGECTLLRRLTPRGIASYPTQFIIKSKATMKSREECFTEQSKRQIQWQQSRVARMCSSVKLNPPCLSNNYSVWWDTIECEYVRTGKKKRHTTTTLLHHHQSRKRTIIVPIIIPAARPRSKCGWGSNKKKTQQNCIHDKEFWYGYTNCAGYLHWALKIVFSLFLRIILVALAACFCLSRVVDSRPLKEKKRGSRSRCVIKCNLNWMANEKGKERGEQQRTFLSEIRLSILSSDGYLRRTRQM